MLSFLSLLFLGKLRIARRKGVIYVCFFSIKIFLAVERAPPTAEDLYELEIDKKLAEAERLQESPVSMFLKVPGLLSKRHLKGSTSTS